MHEEFDIKQVILQQNRKKVFRSFPKLDIRTILSIPICFIIIFFFIVEGCLYVIVRFTGRAAEKWLSRPKVRSLIYRRRECKNYKEYSRCSKNLDNLNKSIIAWKKNDETYPISAYDPIVLRRRIHELRTFRRQNQFFELYQCIRFCLESKLHNTLSHELWSCCYNGTKELSEIFHHELLLSIKFLEQEIENIKDDTLLQDISQLYKIYGSTCIVFSGGAMLGLHHLGVLEVLLKMRKLPTIVAGTSAGAAVAAFSCTRSRSELLQFFQDKESMKLFGGPFNPDSFFLRFIHLIRYGYTIDINTWYDLSNKIYGKMTFAEAYQKTERVLNISVTRAGSIHESLLLNYINAPNVLISTAVLASSAFPYLGCPIHLLEKDPKTQIIHKSKEFFDRFYHDGSLYRDVPTESLKVDWGAKYIIVSQVNPHVFPMLGLRCHGSPGQPIRGWGSSSVYRGGFLLAFIEITLKEHLRFLLRVIALLNIVPSINGINISHVALQSYGGDLNIYPSRLYWNHLKVFNNVNYEEMKWFIHIGRHMIFPKIPLIKTRMDLELALRSFSLNLKKKPTHV